MKGDMKGIRYDNVGQLVLVLDHRVACYAIKIITIGDDSKQDLHMKIVLGTKKSTCSTMHVGDRSRTKKNKIKGLDE